MFTEFLEEQFKSGNQYAMRIKHLLILLGFEARTTGKDDDKGVDIIAQSSVGDNTKFYIQCKYFNTTLSTAPIQEVYAGCALHGNDGYPVVITNNQVTHGARKIARELGVEIIAEPEWKEIQLAFQQNKIPNKMRFGLMGMIMGSSILDYEHIKDSADRPYLPVKPITSRTSKMERHKHMVKERLDDALLLEQEAMQFDQKASLLRQQSLMIQKEVMIRNLDYG